MCSGFAVKSQTWHSTYKITSGVMDSMRPSEDVECDQLLLAQPHPLRHPHGHSQHHLLLHLHERQVDNLCHHLCHEYMISHINPDLRYKSLLFDSFRQSYCSTYEENIRYAIRKHTHTHTHTSMLGKIPK